MVGYIIQEKCRIFLFVIPDCHTRDMSSINHLSTMKLIIFKRLERVDVSLVGLGVIAFFIV